MMPVDLLANLCLSLTIGFGWSRFRLIFIGTTDQATLLSPATTLASAASLSAAALAFSGKDFVMGATILTLGLALATVASRSTPGSPVRVALASASFLVYASLHNPL